MFSVAPITIIKWEIQWIDRERERGREKGLQYLNDAVCTFDFSLDYQQLLTFLGFQLLGFVSYNNDTTFKFYSNMYYPAQISSKIECWEFGAKK